MVVLIVIDYQPVRWAVQEKRYIPTRYPVMAFRYHPSGEGIDMLVCQRKRVRGAAGVVLAGRRALGGLVFLGFCCFGLVLNAKKPSLLTGLFNYRGG